MHLLCAALPLLLCMPIVCSMATSLLRLTYMYCSSISPSTPPLPPPTSLPRCLSPASERWTADQAALHPLIRRRMSEMPEVCTRLALEQEAVSGAIYMKSLKIFRSVPKPAPMPTPAPADNRKSSEEAKPTAVSTWLAPGNAATDEAPSCG
jgi:hypothetical protein